MVCEAGRIFDPFFLRRSNAILASQHYAVLASKVGATLRARRLASYFHCLVGTLIHIFNMIQWPLEFGHNLLYISMTAIEALMKLIAATGKEQLIKIRYLLPAAIAFCGTTSLNLKNSPEWHLLIGRENHGH